MFEGNDSAPRRKQFYGWWNIKKALKLVMMKFSWAISWVKWLSGERTKTEMVFETLVFSLLNHLTWLIARENIILSHRESNKSH
jgi:hypothetical protein